MIVAEFPGIRRRLASLLYESLLLLGVWAATFMLPHLALGMAFGVTLPGPVLILHVVAVFGAYFIWYWSHGGQTLAMQTWKLQLLMADGYKPPLPRLLLRYALAWPSLLLGGIGLLWALFDRDRQFLHDRLAGTRIAFKP
ncbi:MAG: RDD family protein [Gammaproteobacteria bacterium]|nr:RDD family protein [Gammaproteobacteria bacterium]MBU1647088.1 RDD family protein [Gammaproteobacteria bacterium]MBU1972600.1 RDD family protein [Gammaproteobacteria bacterium]